LLAVLGFTALSSTALTTEAVPSRLVAGVLKGEEMPLPTASAASSATPEVLNLTDRLQMIGIHTAPVVAQMVDLQVLGDRPDEDSERHTMSKLGAARSVDSPVAVRTTRRCPVPAAGFRVDRELGDEPLEYVACHVHV